MRAILFTCALTLGLAACSQGNEPAQDSETGSADTSASAETADAGRTAMTIPDPADTDLDKSTATYSGPNPMPIKVGGSATVDACGTAAKVANLNPDGDNFLSVRDAPSAQTKERDRLSSGKMVNVCAAQSGWSAIVYPRDGQTANECGLGTPIAEQRNYTGPCQSGWVDSRYLEQVAG